MALMMSITTSLMVSFTTSWMMHIDVMLTGVYQLPTNWNNKVSGKLWFSVSGLALPEMPCGDIIQVHFGAVQEWSAVERAHRCIVIFCSEMSQVSLRLMVEDDKEVVPLAVNISYSRKHRHCWQSPKFSPWHNPFAIIRPFTKLFSSK